MALWGVAEVTDAAAVAPEDGEVFATTFWLPHRSERTPPMHRRLSTTFTAVAAALVVILGIGALNPAPSSAARRPLTVHAGLT